MRINRFKFVRGGQWLTIMAVALVLISFLCSAVVVYAADGDESVIFLHHSTGRNLYNDGGVAEWIADYNTANGTDYQISEREYPDRPYPWHNYPYDYWNLWINGVCNSDDSDIECMNTLAQDYDVIIFKHCYPGADVLADTGSPSISSDRKSIENYQLQYNALKDMMHNYPDNQFIVWTLAPRHRRHSSFTPETGARANQFVDWVKNTWDEPDDNIFVFDFWGYAAEQDASPANGEQYALKYEYERDHSSSDSHPNTLANESIGPYFAQFIVDAIEVAPDEDPQNDHCSPENIRCVPGEYATVNAAVDAAQNGDTIEVEADTYTGTGIVATLSNDNLTIRGVNGLAHLNAEGVSISNRKAIFVTTGDNITIENIEFSNAVVPDENGAGIRHEGGLLTIRNCYFHDNENGILTSSQDDGELFIENTEFDHNGLGRAGYTHNIYVGHIAKFTMQYSYSHHATHGHNVKSRAAENHILYNRIMDETTGNASYQIDIPNGGRTYIIGNTIHQGASAENSRMISYAAEGVHDDNPVQEIYLSGNTFVNDRSGGRGIRLRYNPTAIVVNNIFDNIGDSYVIDDSPATVYEDNIVGEENFFANRSSYDFHLTADSPAVNMAGNPGTYNGIDLTPLYEYVHPISSKQREANGLLDVGAFEYSGDAADDSDTGDDSTDSGDSGDDSDSGDASDDSDSGDASDDSDSGDASDNSDSGDASDDSDSGDSSGDSGTDDSGTSGCFIFSIQR